MISWVGDVVLKPSKKNLTTGEWIMTLVNLQQSPKMLESTHLKQQRERPIKILLLFLKTHHSDSVVTRISVLGWTAGLELLCQFPSFSEPWSPHLHSDNPTPLSEGQYEQIIKETAQRIK